MPPECSLPGRYRDAEHVVYPTYPTQEWFVEAFGPLAVRASLAARNAPHWQQPIALDIRLPVVIDGVCTCGRTDCVDGSVCLGNLEREMALYRAVIGHSPDVVDMRWSGGAGLPDAGLRRVRDAINSHLDCQSVADFAIHVDPFTDGNHVLPVLRELGATSVTIGHASASPADADVLLDRVPSLVSIAHDVGFREIEAVYPVSGACQCLTLLHESIEALIVCGPTRVHLDHAPGSTPHDPHASVHSSCDNGRHWRDVATRLLDAGYLCIAQNVFALAADGHAVAHRQGRLTRQPNGYSIRPFGVLLALGPRTVGYIGALYYQNHRVTQHYHACLSAGHLPVERGLHLSHDELVRRTIILSLCTNLFINVTAIEAAYHIDFRRAFSTEWTELGRLERAGLLDLDATNVALTSAGRLACGTVCRVFDRHARLLDERTSKAYL